MNSVNASNDGGAKPGRLYLGISELSFVMDSYDTPWLASELAVSVVTQLSGNNLQAGRLS